MIKPTAKQNAWETRIKECNWRLFYWTGCWVLSQALGTFGPRFIWGDNRALTLGAIGLNLGLGIGLILSFIGYLRALDDLQRKIQLESLAMALGVGVVGALSYSLLKFSEIFTFKEEISFVVVLISLSYLVVYAVNTLRYK